MISNNIDNNFVVLILLTWKSLINLVCEIVYQLIEIEVRNSVLRIKIEYSSLSLSIRVIKETIKERVEVWHLRNRILLILLILILLCVLSNWFTFRLSMQTSNQMNNFSVLCDTFRNLLWISQISCLVNKSDFRLIKRSVFRNDIFELFYRDRRIYIVLQFFIIKTFDENL